MGVGDTKMVANSLANRVFVLLFATRATDAVLEVCVKWRALYPTASQFGNTLAEIRPVDYWE